MINSHYVCLNIKRYFGHSKFKRVYIRKRMYFYMEFRRIVYTLQNSYRFRCLFPLLCNIQIEIRHCMV